jgi:adenosine deaminase
MSESISWLIEKMPKVEQHIHIVGSIRPETLRWLATQSDIKVPDLSDPENVARLFRYRDFEDFVNSYSIILRCLKAEDQFERIVYEMLEDEAKQNVRYVEASFSGPDHTHLGLNYSDMVKAINRGIERARFDFGVLCNLKIDLVRDYGPEAGMRYLDVISKCRERVVAIDIGGREHAFPPEQFAAVYRKAKQMGLHLTAHAGETGSPQSIWNAVTRLGVERVGHGVSARDDPALIAHLLKKNISLEMCPVSNLRTGVVDDIRNHPIRAFFDKGLHVTVNSDDPSMFDTNMNREYQTLHDELGFTIEELFHLSLNGLDSSFLPEETKKGLREEFIRQFDTLRGRALGD